MIRSLVDFALNNRFLILAVALLLFIWGIISFHNLPIEAYPDVANNYVQVITQWPGRAAEEVEQQVTVPIEIVMNGLPHLEHLRSTSLFGLSSVMLIFDDESENDCEPSEGPRTAVAAHPAPEPAAADGDRLESGRADLLVHAARAANPAYDLMELKSLEDWVLEKQFKSVPNVVDVASFGGTTREYQVRVDPNKLVSYGLTIGQVEQQLASNNVNAGGSFIEEGLQQINVRALGLVDDRARHRADGHQGAERHAAARQRHRHRDAGRRRSGWARSARRFIGRTADLIDNDDVVEGIVLLRKGRRVGLDAQGDRGEGPGAERPPPAARRQGRPVPRSQRSRALHHAHGAAQPDRGHRPGRDRPVPLPRAMSRGAIIVALTIPFALLFASICLNLRQIPANLLSLGALDFGMVVDGAVVMVENIVRHAGTPRCGEAADRADSRGGPRGAAAGLLCHRDHHHRLPADLHAAARRGPAVQADGLDRRVCAARARCCSRCWWRPSLASLLFREGAREWHNPVLTFLRDRYRRAVRWRDRPSVADGRRRRDPVPAGGARASRSAA